MPTIHARFRRWSATGAACALLIASLPALALTPLPAGQVTDEDAVRLLKAAYRDEAVGIAGEWSARGPWPGDDGGEAVDVSRKVCADSGRDDYGPRMIAVCSAYADAGHVTPGTVDLWLLLDPRGEQAARVGASMRDIDTGSFGTPGDVSFFQVGPARTAFALDSGYANMGWGTSVRSLYYAENDRFEHLLTVATQLDNSGACDPAEDKSCANKALSLECALRADTADAEHGYYDLFVDVSGERGGKSAKTSIPIPYQSGAYVPPTRRLTEEGCDQGF